MKKTILIKSVLIAASLPLLAGCVEREVVYRQAPPPGTVTDDEAPAPPPPQAEVITVAPGPLDLWLWVPGTWEWRGRWVWTVGRWGARPHPGAVWVGPHWGVRGHRHVWVGGGWR
ncbi:MAG TPA: hypothetical protein VIK53_14515 [Verrucomicrobiae bacterium]